MFVCKTLTIYNKSGAYLGAIKSDFINNAKLGEGSLYRLCMNVWEMNHLLFSRTEFLLFNHAINLFLCFSICLKMAQRKCRIGFCLITFEIAVKINLKIRRNFFVHNIDCKIHSFQHFKNYTSFVG